MKHERGLQSHLPVSPRVSSSMHNERLAAASSERARTPRKVRLQQVPTKVPCDLKSQPPKTTQWHYAQAHPADGDITDSIIHGFTYSGAGVDGSQQSVGTDSVSNVGQPCWSG
jgi:hypothetical protein